MPTNTITTLTASFTAQLAEARTALTAAQRELRLLQAVSARFGGGIASVQAGRIAAAQAAVVACQLDLACVVETAEMVLRVQGEAF